MKRVLIAALIAAPVALAGSVASAEPNPSGQNVERIPFRAYRICPSWALKATIGLMADGVPKALAWRRWCYIVEMPLRQNPKHAEEEPEWVIPYDSTSWIAVRIEGDKVIGFESRKAPKAVER